jgi:hypothetical protein
MKTDIEYAALLVPEYALQFGSDRWTRREDGVQWRDWQPQSDTEAGRSDALVLLAAVMKWFEDNCKAVFGPSADDGKHSELIHANCVLLVAKASGNVQQIQKATFAAAVAIGKVIDEATTAPPKTEE